jgi:dTMP kinase
MSNPDPDKDQPMFITLEGPDGSGKTTQVKPLVDFLLSKGYPIFSAREPGGTSIGDQVREILMRLDNKSMDPRTETLLFCAARAQLVSEVIRPQLAKGNIVLLDRYADSTLAYQGYGHQNDLEQIRQILQFATGGLKPDLTILFDIDAETGLHRRQIGGGEWNRMDAYQLELHRRTREGYQEMAKADPKRWVIIDASQTPEMVQSHLQTVILDRLHRDWKKS